MYLKMGAEADAAADEGKLEDEEEGGSPGEKAEFVGEAGETYVPFSSVYGLKGLLAPEAGGGSAGPGDAVEAEPTSPTAEAVVHAKKSNTTSSVFVSSTLSEPDVAEMLTCVSLLLHHQMQEDREVPVDPSIPPPAYDFSEDDSVSSPDELPKLSDFCSFLKKTYRIAKWSPECHIMALVFVNRLTGYTSIRLHNANWRPILLCSLLLAQKLWDDKSLANVDFPFIWRKAMPSSSNSKISLARVNFMERKFLELLQYNVNVKASLYAKYYFELRTLREGEAFPLQPLKHEQLRRLEARSAAFNAEILSAREKEKALDRGARTLGSLKSGY